MINCEWSRIYKTCRENEQFLNKAWFDAWQVYAEEIDSWQTDIKYVSIECNAENYAIISYGIQTVGPFNFVSLAGNYFPQRGIPNTGADPELIEKTADKIFEIVKAEGFNTSGFRMDYVHHEDEFVARLKEQLIKKNWKLITRKRGRNYGIKLLSSEEEFMATLKNRKKSQIRRREKKMARDGNVELKHYNDVSQDQWEKIFKDVELVESNAWIAEKENYKFIGRANQNYWNSLVRDEWFRRALNVWIMYFNDKPVSYSLEMDTEHTRYGMCTSYDKDVAKYGTGITIVLAVIIQAIESGKTVYDAGIGDDGYKGDLGAKVIATLDEDLYFPPTLMGRLAYYTALFKKFIENLVGTIKYKLKNIFTSR